MAKLLQINVTANWGSHGRIAEAIGRLAMADGWESVIAYGRHNAVSESRLIRIGRNLDTCVHGLETRLFDRHGLASKHATKALIREVEKIQPDLIHLHNLHGYYISYPILFDFLKSYGAPVVWTLHDCWTFTGHCTHYSPVGCDRWTNGCHHCPLKYRYPASSLFDRSRRNYKDKKSAFTGVSDLTVVAAADWLRGEVAKSFLGEYPCVTIHNGIDLSVFRPCGQPEGKNGKSIIGVSNGWDSGKGLGEFFRLREMLPADYEITLVGLTSKQADSLPSGICGITRTGNVEQLAEIYSAADVFVNPTVEDTFPTTNLEALACGTPVITYRTGGSPETVDEKTGLVVDCGDTAALAAAVRNVCENHLFRSSDCRERAVSLFDKDMALKKYIALYNSILAKRL